jgi:hypothetical protein
MKRLIWPGIILLGIILLLGGIAGVGKFAFSNRFNAELAALKAKGEPTTLVELLGDPIPNDRNAAGPYLEIRAWIEGRTYEPDLKIIDDFPARGSYVSPDTWSSAEQALSRTQPLRQLLDDALARPECRFEINMNDPLATLCPHLSAIRRMSRWLRVDATVNAKNGRIEQAADDVCAQVAIAQSVKDEPGVIHHLYRMALLAIAAKTVPSVADYGAFNEDQARRVFDAFGSFDFAQSCRQGWRGERVIFLHYSDPQNLQYLLASASYSAVGNTSPRQSLGRPLAALYTRTAMKGDLAAFMRIAAEQMDGAGLNYKDAKAKGLLGIPSSIPTYAGLTKTLLPTMMDASLKRYAVEADVSQTRVLLALQAYKVRFGRYPATMQELKTKLGWKLPVDPFSGKDLIYKRQAKGFILYSVGPDMKDDGGLSPIAKVESLDDKGDIVLRWDR